jgi:hypothetical protein
MQASCDRGMRASISPDDWDCLPPLNIHDEAFNESTQTLPSTKPLTDWTRTSFLCKASQHLHLRMDLLTRINSISRTLELDTVMAFDDRIRQILDSLPSWPERPQTVMPRTLARLLLHEFLLLLHQPFALQSVSETRFFYSRCARRESALAVMKTYSELPESKQLALSNLRDDYFRACLASSHDIVISTQTKSDLLQDKALTMDLIDKSLDMMKRRVKALGQGFHSYWISSSALSLAQSKMTPTASREKCAQEAADRVVKLHDELMELQRPGYTGGILGLPSNGDAVDGGVLTNGSNQAYSEISPFDPFGGTMFDFDMPDIWTAAGLPEI